MQKTYTLSEKAQKITPYEPLEGEFRIRLDANESFLLPTERDRARMVEAVNDLPFNRYPDPLAKGCCEAFAALYDISSRYVTAFNGSDEAISVILSTFLQKGEAVLTLEPDFSMYRFYTSITETPCVTLPKNDDLTVDVDRVLQTIQEHQIRLLIFSNPCNPTSLGLGAEEVRRLITSTDALVVLDEAYMDFWDQTLIHEVHQYSNVILLRTSSKALGLAALRLGFAVANEELTGILRAAKSPYNVNAVTQALGEIVLGNPLYKKEYIPLILLSRDALMESLRSVFKPYEDFIPVKVYASQTNFVFMEMDKARFITEQLAQRSIAVRCFGEKHIRITAGTQFENAELCGTLRGIFREMKQQEGESICKTDAPK